MAESAKNYSLQIVSERFTNLAEKGEVRGQEAFLKVALDYFCYAGLSTDTTQVPRASHFCNESTLGDHVHLRWHMIQRSMLSNRKRF